MLVLLFKQQMRAIFQEHRPERPSAGSLKLSRSGRSLVAAIFAVVGGITFPTRCIFALYSTYPPARLWSPILRVYSRLRQPTEQAAELLLALAMSNTYISRSVFPTSVYGTTGPVLRVGPLKI